MTYEMYRLLFVGGGALCAVMLVVTIILFFAMRIPRVIGDLTGANARKAIERIRSQNENSGEKTYKSSRINRERGKITDRITPTGRLVQQSSTNGGAMKTEKIETDVLIQQARDAWQSREEADDTDLLMYQETEDSETTVLDTETEPAGETTVLSQEENYYFTPSAQTNQATEQAFEIEYEITYIHSDVLIS